MYIITHVIFFSILILYLTAFLFYFSLHLLAYFLNFLLYLTPIIIINHPLIFICMTISNIITFSILLTLSIIIFVANVFRQPIFICLGEDIFNNFPLYMYVMFSSILPTTYIVTILIKLLKTRNLDFSFRLTDLKDKITILSILFLTISLYISYFYI